MESYSAPLFGWLLPGRHLDLSRPDEPMLISAHPLVIRQIGLISKASCSRAQFEANSQRVVRDLAP
jgi:hypothetical protein